jgi:hypothetical protein
MERKQILDSEKMGNVIGGTIDHTKLRDVLQSARPLPFHDISGRKHDFPPPASLITTFQTTAANSNHHDYLTDVGSASVKKENARRLGLLASS